MERKSFAKGDTGSPQLEDLASEKEEANRSKPGISVETPFDPEEAKDKIGTLAHPGFSQSFALDSRALSSKTGNRSEISDDKSDSLRL